MLKTTFVDSKISCSPGDKTLRMIGRFLLPTKTILQFDVLRNLAENKPFVSYNN
jgi:hypothetical protein